MCYSAIDVAEQCFSCKRENEKNMRVFVVVLQKSEENAEDVKSHFPAQLRQPLQTGWR
jgi:hypothetical protein